MAKLAQGSATKKPVTPMISPRHEPLRSWLIGVALAAAVVLLPRGFHWIVRCIAGWDTLVVVLLIHPWWIIVHATPESTQRRAATEDPDRRALFGIALLCNTIGLVATAVILRHPGTFVPDDDVSALVVLGVVAVVGSWGYLHTIFALRYARLYYFEDGDVGGLEFAGGPPDDFDFAYFSFTIGMTFQVSDVEISNRSIRRTALIHGLLSFLFNTVVVALAINLVFGRLQ